MGLEHLSDIRNVARFLGAPEDRVLTLVEEGRLAGVLVDALRRRGLAVTPRLKDSVEAVVRTVSPAEGDSKPDSSGSDATITIMFTDIVESTAMTSRLGDRRARDVLRAHNQIIRGQVEAHGGTEVKSMGDGFMLTFPSATRGVACAVAVQRQLADYNGAHPENPLYVRIGLAVGEPLKEERDFLGKAVILASRINGEAEGAHVLVSEIVRALAAGSEEFDFREAGDFALKGFSGRHRLYEVTWGDS